MRDGPWIKEQKCFYQIVIKHNILVGLSCASWFAFRGKRHRKRSIKNSTFLSAPKMYIEFMCTKPRKPCPKIPQSNLPTSLSHRKINAVSKPCLQFLSCLLRARAYRTTSLLTPLPLLPCSSLISEFGWRYTGIYILCGPQQVTTKSNGFSPSQKNCEIPKAALHKQIHHHLCILLKHYSMVFPFPISVIGLIKKKSIYQPMLISD